MTPRTRTFRGACSLTLVCCVAVAGCGGGQVDRTFTPDELGAALLTVGDLGQGWSQTQRVVFTAREPENPSVEDTLAFCPDAAEQVAALRELAADAGADVELAATEESGSFHLLRQQAWSDAQVPEYLTTLAEAVDLCVGASWSEPDGNEVTWEALEAPAVGDEATSVAAVAVLTGPDGDSTWRTRLTVARFGDVLMAVSDTLVEPVGTEPWITEPDWPTIVETAGERFTELLDD